MSKLWGPTFVLVCLLLSSVSQAGPDPSAAGLSAASVAPDGLPIPGDASRGPTCAEVDVLPQDCGVMPPTSTCLDAVPLAICVRKTTRTRITMCAKEDENSHEGHVFTWQLVEGSLPPDLILKDFGKSTAYVGGDLPTIVPPPGTTNGKYFGVVGDAYCSSFKILATDTCAGHTCVSNFPITFRTIAPGPPVIPVITTPSFPDAILGVFYSQPITAVGGVPLKIYSISVGTLPPGLDIDPLTGALEGIPTLAGDFPVTIRVAEDPNDPLLQPDPGCPGAVCAPFDDTQQYTLRVLAATPTPTPTLTPAASPTPTVTRTPTPTVTPRPVPSNVVIDAQLPPDFTSAYSFSLTTTSLLTVVASLVSPCVSPERGVGACEVFFELFDPSGQSRARILLTTSPQTLVFPNAEPGTWHFVLSVSAGCTESQCIRIDLSSEAAAILPSGGAWPLVLAVLLALGLLGRRVRKRRV